MANFMEFFRNRKNGRGSSTWLPYLTESWWGYRSWQSYAGVTTLTILSEEKDKQALETIALLVDLPKKKFDPGSLRYSLHKHAEASLNSGINLREAVRIPPGECYNDWLAVHVVDFFNRINLIYGTVTDFCTPETCPTMSGGPKYEYRWADGAEYKKPTPLPATQYITLLMEWVESQINNEDIFPVKSNIPFPKNFGPTCKKILTRLFRVFVHVYIHHFERLVAIGAEAHVNMCYKHFYYFVTEFDLVNQKELEPLAEMTKKVCKIYSPSK